jgi:hypothetical protein
MNLITVFLTIACVAVAVALGANRTRLLGCSLCNRRDSYRRRAEDGEHLGKFVILRAG